MFGKRRKPVAPDRFECSWCEDEIPEDAEVLAVGARARPEFVSEQLEGQFVDIFLVRRNRTVSAVVVTDDSPAKKEGKDMVFLVCSESCAEALRQSVDREIELVQ